MSGPREEDRDTPTHEARRALEAERERPARVEDKLTRSLETALEMGVVDPTALVRLLTCRLSLLESRLVRADRWMDRMRRRFSQVESQLAGLSVQTSEHEEALQMMCSVLKELDDPYGFGLSLDERIAYDEKDQEEEGA